MAFIIVAWITAQYSLNVLLARCLKSFGRALEFLVYLSNLEQSAEPKSKFVSL